MPSIFCNILSIFKNLLKHFKMPIPYYPIDQPPKLKYFELSEFESPDEQGYSGKKMNFDFLEQLDKARGIAGIPFRITSGYRSEKWNLKVGGRWGSSHKKGLAVDIHIVGSRERCLIIKSLLEVGITRIGISKTFIHCDVDKQKDQDVMWLYN
jgi:zinc D-Ala-D-Ala carboxypeptidase